MLRDGYWRYNPVRPLELTAAELRMLRRIADGAQLGAGAFRAYPEVRTLRAKRLLDERALLTDTGIEILELSGT